MNHAQMQFTLTRNTPISRYWKPKLVFSGTSIMGINPENGERGPCSAHTLLTPCLDSAAARGLLFKGIAGK